MSIRRDRRVGGRSAGASRGWWVDATTVTRPVASDMSEPRKTLAASRTSRKITAIGGPRGGRSRYPRANVRQRGEGRPSGEAARTMSVVANAVVRADGQRTSRPVGA